MSYASDIPMSVANNWSIALANEMVEPMNTQTVQDTVSVVIVDCEKAGIIGGPFQVLVIKNGKQTASRGGLRSLERAEQVAAELRRVYARRVRP